jgi:ABC-2 type transport system permease protein
MLNIIKRLFLHHRVFLIASSVLLGVFQFLTGAIISSTNLPAALDQFMFFAPPIIRVIMEQTMLGGSAAGIMAFTWNHPATHAVVTAVAITLGARAVAGEIENGVIELILAQPVSRARYLLANLMFAMVSMILVASAGLVGMVAGQTAFGLQLFDWDRLLRLFANLFLLQMSFYSLTLLFSSFGREAGRVASLGVFVAIVSFLDNVIASLWNKAAFMRPYSLHSYYDPRTVLIDGHLPAASVAVLGTFAVAAIAGVFARFLTRDLP